MGPAFNTRSVRFRTTAGAALAFAVLLVISGVAVTALVARELYRAADAALVEQVQDRAILLDAGADPDAIVQVVGDEVAAVVFGADGSVLARSGTPDPSALAGLPDGLFTIEVIIDDGEDGDGEDTDHSHREEVRVAVRSTAGGGHIAVATEGEQTRDTIAAIRGMLIVASLITAATTAGLAWIVTGRALAPVLRIRRDLDAVVEIGGRSRVTEPGTGDEVAALASALNDVLDRLEDQSVARRRFVADASHELKSPVANARALIETSKGARPIADRVSGGLSGDVDQRVLDELDRLQSLVDDLLYLAGSDERAPSRPKTRVDLDDLAFDEAERVTARTTRHIDASGIRPAVVWGDRLDLARAVRNLVENAARHAETTVAIAIEDGGGDWILSVTDDGPGIPAEERHRIFERFTRLGGDRSRVDGGTGLGLSIVASIAADHGGDVAAAEPGTRGDGPTPSGARFELQLPKADNRTVQGPSSDGSQP